MRRISIITGLVLLLASSAADAKPADWNQNDWIKFVEQAVQTGMGEALSAAGGVTPLVDVYSALSGASGALKAGLHGYFQRRMRESIDDPDMVDKFQAYDSCLSGDCTALQQYTVASQPRPPNNCTPGQDIEQPESRVGTRVTVKAATIHVFACPPPVGTRYIYEYHDPQGHPTGFRVISPPDWDRPIAGQDFPTMEQAMGVLTRIQDPVTPSTSDTGGVPTTMTLVVNGHSITVDLTTEKAITASGPTDGSSTLTLNGVGKFSNVAVTLSTDKSLPSGWSMSAGTCCQIAIPICKTESSPCVGSYTIPADWNGVNVLAQVTKADPAGNPIRAVHAGVVLYK